MRQQVSF